MTGTKVRPASRAWALGATATLVVSFAVAFLALFSSAPAGAVTTNVKTLGARLTSLPASALPPGVASAPSVLVPKALPALIGAAPHGPYGKLADDCASCHRTHTAKSANLVKSVSPQSNLCFSCHDGLGANTDVRAQFTDALVPPNDNLNRLYYRHDTLNPAKSHTKASLNEFGGVSNRHTECGDCHNPHQANGTNGTTTPAPSSGVTASGRQAGVSGVSVANGPAGTAPTYTFLDGKTPATSINREYQLCFKCHSGFTTLSSNGSFGPSRYRLDKGIEFNPNNPSYHPVEAAGKNTTPAMAASLAGGTTWRLTTGSTIRCVNCHASSTKAPATPALNQPPANGDLPMHTSRNPGILLAKYRNRVLMSATEPYSAANFALCFMCHSQAPFTDSNSTATNFSEHAKHVSNLDSRRSEGGTPDIDTIGGGRGNAICAECHFRQHSTSFQVPGQTVPGSRLVSFSTNVSKNGTTLQWTRSATVGSGSCTLTCHSYNHSNKSYSAGGR